MTATPHECGHALRSTYRLACDVRVERVDDAIVLMAPHRLLQTPLRIPPTFIPAAEQLIEHRLDRGQLETAFLGCPDCQPAEAYFLLDLLDRGGFLTERLFSDDRALLEFRPSLPFDRSAESAAERLKLSRFALLRADDGGLVLESALTARTARIMDPVLLPLIHRLARGEESEAVDEPVAREILDALRASGFVVALDANEGSPEDQAPLATWEFHDLLFHARSRAGSHRNRSGATYRFRDRLPAEPFSDPAPDDPGLVVDLAVPVCAERGEDSLAGLLLRRRSVRAFGTTPISADQLAAMLYQAARLLHFRTDPKTGDTAQRPFPSGGGIHELVIYPLINRCTGLARGIYRYDAVNHQMIRARPFSADAESIVRTSAAAMAMFEKAEEIQVVLLVASRFPRLAWKYESMAYALTLKNLGCLYQTLYLVATTMRIAPCAIGYGDANLFARATGTDPLGEPLIGEFVVGSAAGETDEQGSRNNAIG